jgi:vacuolar protein sorting-associated protein 54
MSDNDSSSSRPASPISALPDVQSSRLQRLPLNSISRKAGPGSVLSETTEGHGDYYASTVHLPFSFSSTSLALPTVPQDWSSAKHGFHGTLCRVVYSIELIPFVSAISTVVNSPHKRSAPPKAHSSIPTVTPTILPRPNRKILDQYVQNISLEWERFQRSGQLELENAVQVEGPSGSLDLSRNPRPSTSKQLPSLHTIPPVFFDPQFNLGDPSIFNAVTEQGEEPSTLLSLSLSHSLPLLEKLSHYADTIEQHLVREVSLRSTSFFAALSNLQDLQTESEQCIERISQLKTTLKEVDEKNAKKGLAVVRMETRLWNLESVKEGVRLISNVVEMTGVAKGLTAAGQWGEALGVVEELQALWEREPTSSPSSIAGIGPPLPSIRESSEDRSSPVQESSVAERISASTTSTGSKPVTSVPLPSLHAFSSLPAHLQALTMEIATSLTSELVNVLRIDLTDRTAGSLLHEAQNQTLKDRLRPLLQGLLRAKGLREAALAWREAVLVEVQSCIKLVCLFVHLSLQIRSFIV